MIRSTLRSSDMPIEMSAAKHSGAGLPFSDGPMAFSLIEHLQNRLEATHPCSALSQRETLALLNISRTSLYLKITNKPSNPYFDPDFPQPFKYSERGVGVFFLEHELIMWLIRRATKREGAQTQVNVSKKGGRK
jgi:predicted DNA-binding transcriptional regulator AlpA